MIQLYNIPQYNIPVKPRYISHMTLTEFINGKDEPRWYVNPYFQVLFYTIFSRHLIMNIDWEKMINNFDDSEYDFISYFQKIVILWVVQHIFCEMLIRGRKLFTLTRFFTTDIRKTVQNYWSKFERLLHENISKKHFINKEIIYIDFYGEIKLLILFNYMKAFLA